MKDYLNREERNQLLFLFGFMAQCETVDGGLKSALSDDEKDGIRKAGQTMSDTLAEILARLAQHNKAVSGQLIRESRTAKMNLYVPGSNYIETERDTITIRRDLARKWAELTAGQCTGCDGVEECAMRMVRDALDEPPVNADSDVCQYRIAEDELGLDDEDAYTL